MYELIQAGARTYYIDCPAKVGLYLLNDREVCLIDGGSDKDAARRILKILSANDWALKMVLATHSHADHVGGCAALASRTGCRIYAPEGDLSFTLHPEFESALLYGGCPPNQTRNKFLMAQPSPAMPLTEDCLPAGMELLQVDGHCPAMMAFRTPDGVWFLGDCLSSDAILEKYHVSYIYDIGQYLATLEKVKTLEGACFIPAHAPAAESITDLADRNIEKVRQVAALVKSLCTDASFEDILAGVFSHFALNMDFGQYLLVGSTIRGYLSYLLDAQEIKAFCRENRLFWSAS